MSLSKLAQVVKYSTKGKCYGNRGDTLSAEHDVSRELEHLSCLLCFASEAKQPGFATPQPNKTKLQCQHAVLLARQNRYNKTVMGEMCTPFASVHVEVNGGGGGGEGGVTYAQNRAVKVALAAWSQAVGSLWELHLLPHAQHVRHPQPIWQLINGGFLQR